MAVDLVEIQARLDALRASRSTGVLEVSFRNGENEQRVRYKTDAEMAAAIADLENQIGGTSGNRPPRSIIIRNSGRLLGPRIEGDHHAEFCTNR